MRMLASSLAAALLFAGAPGAWAGDGDAPAHAGGCCKPAGDPAVPGRDGKAAGDAPACKGEGAAAGKDGGAGCAACGCAGCKEAGKDAAACAKCLEAAKAAKAGTAPCAKCAAKKSLTEVSLALLEEGGAAAKAALDAIPAEAAKKIADARTLAREAVEKIKKAAAAAKADLESAVADAKEAGAELACEVRATFESDMQTLRSKAADALEKLSGVVSEVLAPERLADAADRVAKAREAAKAALRKAAETLRTVRPAGETVIYRCGCSKKTWTQATSAPRACPFCGPAMPDCGEKVDPGEKAETKPEKKDETPAAK